MNDFYCAMTEPTVAKEIRQQCETQCASCKLWEERREEVKVETTKMEPPSTTDLLYCVGTLSAIAMQTDNPTEKEILNRVATFMGQLAPAMDSVRAMIESGNAGSLLAMLQGGPVT